MTKKDYIAIAEVFKHNRPQEGIKELQLWNTLKLNMMEIFQEDNPRFDNDRFLQACQ